MFGNFDNIDGLIVPIALVILACCTFCCALAYLKKSRIIQNVPTSKIRSAAQGYIELDGKAMDYSESPLYAPLSKRHCVWFSYSIEELISDGDGGNYWRTVEDETSMDYIKMSDGTGLCHIDPEGADIVGAESTTWTGTTFYPSQVPSRRMSQRGRQSQSTSLFGGLVFRLLPTSTLGLGSLLGRRFSNFTTGYYRYTEEYIPANSFLYALGYFETKRPPTLAETAQQKQGDLLNAWKQDRKALLEKFDTNGDGEIDLDEWQQVRKSAEKAAMEAAQSEQAEALEGINMMYKPPKNKRNPFIIATEDPKKLVNRFRFYSALSTTAFLASIGALAFLSNMF